MVDSNPFAALDLEPPRRIDYVFVAWPKAGGRGHAVDGMVPSDHYGVLATIRA